MLRRGEGELNSNLWCDVRKNETALELITSVLLLLLLLMLHMKWETGLRELALLFAWLGLFNRCFCTGDYMYFVL